MLLHLRRWLEDEHEHKKQAAFDTSEWSEVTWKTGIPQQVTHSRKQPIAEPAVC